MVVPDLKEKIAEPNPQQQNKLFRAVYSRES